MGSDAEVTAADREKAAPCGCRYTGTAGLRDVRVIERCVLHLRAVRAIRRAAQDPPEVSET